MQAQRVTAAINPFGRGGTGWGHQCGKAGCAVVRGRTYRINKKRFYFFESPLFDFLAADN